MCIRDRKNNIVKNDFIDILRKIKNNKILFKGEGNDNTTKETTNGEPGKICFVLHALVLISNEAVRFKFRGRLVLSPFLLRSISNYQTLTHNVIHECTKR